MIVPRPRSEMRRIREVLRLHTELGSNLSAIATGARLARSTVRAYLARAAAAGMEAGAEARLSDAALEAALFPPAPAAAGRAVPDWSAIDQELRRHKHVTRKLPWLEYKTAHPDGFEFSQFKLRLSEWQKASGRGLSMRQRCTMPGRRCRSTTPVTWSPWSRTGRRVRRRYSWPACPVPG